ncbi:sensor histidine kinase [Microvirga sp. 2MCAF38]|uniref:sensor histidine kinase n=1 Tax=Microvirga sp. 2MCAF38 TaxID=3232989 RepID=UPI003F9B0EA3
MIEAAILPEEDVSRVKRVLISKSYPGTAVAAHLDLVLPAQKNAPALGIATDINARKAAEQDLQALPDQLLNLVAEERRRIAVELHDSTSQHLAVISLSLMQLRSAVDMTPRVHDLLQDMAVAIDSAAREIRTFSYLLHPPHIELLGLDGSIRDFTKGFARRTGLNVDLDVQGDLSRIPPDLRTGIFRIVQEAFMNVHRHARASTIALSLAIVEDQACLAIADNGRGIPVDESGRHTLGVGIPGMQDRVRHFRGIFEMSSDGNGTRIMATIPLV